MAWAAMPRKCARFSNDSDASLSSRRYASCTSAVVCSVRPGFSRRISRAAIRRNSAYTRGNTSSKAAWLPAPTFASS